MLVLIMKDHKGWPLSMLSMSRTVGGLFPWYDRVIVNVELVIHDDTLYLMYMGPRQRL